MSKTRRVAIMLDLEWPYKRHADLFAGTQQYARKNGHWQCVVDEYPLATLPKRRTGQLPYDGVIGRATRELADRTRRLGVPLVNVWLSSPVRDLPGVYADYVAIGRLRAEHLMTRGFRRFACLTFGRDRAQEIERRAFLQTVSDAGFECHATVIKSYAQRNQRRWQQRQQLIAESMDCWTPPVGVFVGAEHVGRQVAQMCLNRGWHVPQDAAIITGQNELTLCEHPAPSLTSVEVGFERIGYEAAHLLDRLMDGESPPAEPILLPPVGIVVRESTDFFAVEDAVVAAALRFIADHIHEPIGVPDVAAAVSTSRPTLNLRFRKHLGRPIAAEIRRLRLERAKRELAQSDQTIYRIAHDAGFGDAKTFSKIFRREVGMTPREYRRKNASGWVI